MIYTHLTAVSLSLCWMFSPDALVFLANGVGKGGVLFLAALAAGALIIAIVLRLNHSFGPSGRKRNSFLLLHDAFGPLFALTITLACRLGLVILLPTGMLVTAGFTFNETVLQWFPNFGFSSLLLTVIFLLHMIGEKTALTVQAVFVTLTTGGLLLLSTAGIIFAAPPLPALLPDNIMAADSLSFVFLPLLLFLGADHDYEKNVSSRFFAISFGLTVLALWAVASYLNVAAGTLANSTIPYAIAAREILGQPGRIIMAVVIISGACALVNGLFLQSSASLQAAMNYLQFPRHLERHHNLRILATVFTISIGAAMATGLAGSEHLADYIYATLLLWLCTGSAACYGAATKQYTEKKVYRSFSFLLSGLLTVAVACLLVTHEQTTDLIIYALSTCGFGAATAVYLLRAAARKNLLHKHSD